jgi:hypothetical protein
MTMNRNTLLVIVAAFALGWWISGPAKVPPKPLEDRPILRWVIKAAKTMLWVAVFVEPPPEEVEPQLARAQVGEDGYKVLEHRRGW